MRSVQARRRPRRAARHRQLWRKGLRLRKPAPAARGVPRVRLVVHRKNKRLETWEGWIETGASCDARSYSWLRWPGRNGSMIRYRALHYFRIQDAPPGGQGLPPICPRCAPRPRLLAQRQREPSARPRRNRASIGPLEERTELQAFQRKRRTRFRIRHPPPGSAAPACGLVERAVGKRRPGTVRPQGKAPLWLFLLARLPLVRFVRRFVLACSSAERPVVERFFRRTLAYPHQ